MSTQYWSSSAESASMSGNVTKGTWPDAMAYAFVLLDEDDFNHVVRMLPSSVGRDGESKGDPEEDRCKRRKTTKDNKNRKPPAADTGLAQVIAAEGDREDKRALLEMMMKYGTAEDKAKALATIREGLEAADKNVSSSSSSASSASSGGHNDSFGSNGNDQSREEEGDNNEYDGDEDDM
jgi:hypothetical protein